MENQPNQETVELKVLREVADNDADFEFLRGADDYELDGVHYQLTKMYGLAFKCPSFFANMRDLKADGFHVEAQISIEEEKFILLVSRNTMGANSESSESN